MHCKFLLLVLLLPWRVTKLQPNALFIAIFLLLAAAVAPRRSLITVRHGSPHGRDDENLGRGRKVAVSEDSTAIGYSFVNFHRLLHVNSILPRQVQCLSQIGRDLAVPPPLRPLHLGSHDSFFSIKRRQTTAQHSYEAGKFYWFCRLLFAKKPASIPR